MTDSVTTDLTTDAAKAERARKLWRGPHDVGQIAKLIGASENAVREWLNLTDTDIPLPTPEGDPRQPDPELTAMRTVLDALEPLDVSARCRILHWVESRLDILRVMPESPAPLSASQLSAYQRARAW